MWRASKSRFDVATNVDQGSRPYQQDALLANFPTGEDWGIGILADGMGGHASGDVASGIVVGQTFAELRSRLSDCTSVPARAPQTLRAAVNAANAAVDRRATGDATLKGMGSTVVACMAMGPDLYWASVGDSLLLLCREGNLLRLNEDHSMAPQIDAMVASGMLSQDFGANHPDRHQLTSAVCGDALVRVDCPDAPFKLRT
ncbi:MAG: protein phosphatase 2C domain-containing protein, partial [Pseudomonadota bacterium]